MPANALDKITLRGFKSIGSIEDLALRPINVLIGTNGSGKSNFIGAFSFLHAIRNGQLQDYVTAAGGSEKLLHFGSKTTQAIDFHLSFANGVNQYELRLSPTKDDSLFPAKESVYFWKKSEYKEPYAKGRAPRANRLEAAISDPNIPSPSTASYVRDRLGGWRLYHLHDTSAFSPMRRTAKIDDNQFLRPDGSNLASFLYFLREKHQASYSLIRGTIQLVAPFFDDFQLQPRRLKADDVKLEWRHRKSDQYFDSSSLSDGTLRFIALAALFLQPDMYKPSAILVDEPELGLHPYAVEMLASLVQQASTNTQVVLSTQSSLLLDKFDPDDILVADRVQGSTEITRLDPARLRTWLQEYSLGQLWEKNEIGGRPQSN